MNSRVFLPHLDKFSEPFVDPRLRPTEGQDFQPWGKTLWVDTRHSHVRIEIDETFTLGSELPRVPEVSAVRRSLNLPRFLARS